MSPDEKSIYTSENQKTYRENFNSFLQYVSTSVGKEKEERERVYKTHLNEMTVPEMKSEMIAYHEKVSKGGFFGPNKQNTLEDTLLNMHYHEALGVTKMKEFADRLKADPDFKKFTIADEAKNLLSGSKLYSMEVSAKESKGLRETIVSQDKQIVQLNAQKTELTGTLSKVNKVLTNLVTNLKQKAGFSEEKINDFMNTAPEIEKSPETKKNVVKEGKKYVGIGM